MKHGKAENLCSPPRSTGRRERISSGPSTVVLCFYRIHTMAAASPGPPFSVDPTVSDMTNHMAVIHRPHGIDSHTVLPASATPPMCVTARFSKMTEGYSKEVQGPEHASSRVYLPHGHYKPEEPSRESRTAPPGTSQWIPEWMEFCLPQGYRTERDLGCDSRCQETDAPTLRDGGCVVHGLGYHSFRVLGLSVAILLLFTWGSQG